VDEEVQRAVENGCNVETRLCEMFETVERLHRRMLSRLR
jgi:hypothetical protein